MAHEHQLEAILIRNPDMFLYASREDIVVAWRCTTCPHVKPSQGWDGASRIRRNELCECCDGLVEKSGEFITQYFERDQSRLIEYCRCTECNHKQYCL